MAEPATYQMNKLNNTGAMPSLGQMISQIFGHLYVWVCKNDA